MPAAMSGSTTCRGADKAPPNPVTALRLCERRPHPHHPWSLFRHRALKNRHLEREDDNDGLTHAHLWDITAVGALEDVVSKMRRHAMTVEVVGLNEASAILVDRHAPLMREAGVSVAT